MTPILGVPEHVTVADCWARDGLQNEPSFIATDAKVAVLDALTDAGVTQVEAVSFSSLKASPQFADAEEVLRRIKRRDGVMVRCITPNMRGLERAIECTQAGAGVDAIGFPLSASETAARGPRALNFSFYRNQRLDDLLARASQLSYRVERQKLYARAQAMLASELPWIPLYVRLMWGVARPEIRGLRLHPTGFHRLDTVFLDPAGGAR